LWRVVPFAAWLLSAGLVVALVSVGAARRLISPLRDLAWAAERVGLDRGAKPIAERGPREIRVIVRAFNRMRERLQRFVDDRTQMLASISHDLRTPLTRLRLRIEMSEDEEVRRGGLSDIAAMETMVAETLSFATHDAHKEAARATDLAVLVAGVCDDAVDAGGDVRYRGPVHLTHLCQPVGMSRAVANLVGNAVKFGGRSRVLVADRGAEIAIVILDRGPGLPESELEEVFRPFYRLAGSEPDGPSGAGLGLAVVRNVVRAHGGDVVLRNRRLGGLAAIVTLPVSSPG
jgi:signal transduction histidine kinase